MKYLIPHNKAISLLTAGNAQLVFENQNTKKHRDYHVKFNKRKQQLYVYYGREALGIIIENNTRFCGFGYNKEIMEFKYLFEHLLVGTLNPVMKIFHTGQCCACNRHLTDPISIELGIGPECRKRM